LTVGTMNFGKRTSAPEARRIIDRALERGATFFDTANVYADGESERIVGQALQGRREGVRIATKVGLLRREGKSEGLSQARVVAAADESLERLKTDRIDLYYLHAPDPATPIAQSLEGISTLLQSGKILAWGVSNFAAWQIVELNLCADALGLPRPQASQVLYNLLVRQLDLEYFSFARRHPIHTTVYNPLAGGLLARAPALGAPVPRGSRFEANPMYRRRYWTDAMFELTERFRELANSCGLSLVALAYAWLAGRPGVDSILSGPGSVEHLDAALDACALELSPEVRTRIDDIHRAFVGTDACYAR
jgi:aryl-alcohol dehydrogenase-like predicted oxidoreductase